MLAKISKKYKKMLKTYLNLVQKFKLLLNNIEI